MMGFLNEERKTEDLDPETLLLFGEQFCCALLDWFKLLEKHKLARIRRAVKLVSQKPKKQRTVADIIGSEDFELYKSEIELEMRKIETTAVVP